MTYDIKPLTPVELTDLELDAVAGGANSLIEVSNNKVTVKDINVGVAANVLTNKSGAGVFQE